MAGKDSATAGEGSEDPTENEIESFGSSLRQKRRRRGGVVGGAPSPTPASMNYNLSSLPTSSGGISTRLRTLASSPTLSTDILSDGGGAAAVVDSSVGGRSRRSGRMVIPAPTRSADNKDNLEVMEEENEFVDVPEISSRNTTAKEKKKRKRSSFLLSREKDDSIIREGEETVITKSRTATKAHSENHDTDYATKAIKKRSKSLKKDKRPLVLLGEKPRGTYECDYCGSDITRAPRIRCADCPDFDLCLECFADADHHHMAKYKRDEEAQRRKNAAKSAGLTLPDVELMSTSSLSAGAVGGGRKGGRLGSSKNIGVNDNKNDGKDGDDELGSYVGGIWIPYFRHTPEHRYIVSDSTRYVLFPSFRGVRAVVVESVDTSQSVENVVADIGSSGGVASEGAGEVTTDTSLKVREENEAMAPAIENVPITTGEDQHSPRKLSNTVISVDEAANEDENATAEMLLEIESRETDTLKGIKRAKSNDRNEINANMDTSHDIPEASGAAKVEARRNDVVASALSTNDAQPAEIANSEATDNSCSAIDHESKSQTQSYIVTDDAKNSWTVEEDLRLLDGILSCGLGNWSDVAEHVNGTISGDGGGLNSGANGEGGSSWMKTDKQCMERYLDDFMGRYGYILPPYTMVPESQGGCFVDEEGDAKRRAAVSLAPDTSDGESSGVDSAARKRPRRSASSSFLGENDWAPGFKSFKFHAVPTEKVGDYAGIWPHPYIPQIEGIRMGDEVGRDLWYRSEQHFIRQIASTATSDEAETFRKEFIERRTQNQPGYEAKVLPPRLEDMKQLPGAELAGYMPRRGEFDVEWDNDAEKSISEMEFTCDDTEADRELKLDVLRIFNAKLAEREKRKRFIIDRGLLNYRENQEKLWQMAPDERQLVQRMRIFARYQTREEHEAFVLKIIEAKRLRKEIAKLQTYRRMGITSLADAEKYEMDKTRRELHRSAWMKKEEEIRKAVDEAARVAKEHSTSLGIAPPAPSQVPSTSSQLHEAVNAGTNHSLQVWRQFKRSKNDYQSESETKTKAAKVILKDKPGFELLTKKESDLCNRLLLLPQDYLDIKKALIAESIAQGIWDPAEECVQTKNKAIFKVDVTQRDNIIDFVLASGWIPTRPSSHS